MCNGKQMIITRRNVSKTEHQHFILRIQLWVANGTLKRGSTITETNHDDQVGEIYPTMLNELNCTLCIIFHVFIAVAVMIMVCGRRSLWPSWYKKPIKTEKH